MAKAKKKSSKRPAKKAKTAPKKKMPMAKPVVLKTRTVRKSSIPFDDPELRRARQRRYKVRKQQEVQDIGEIPPVADPARRAAATASFKVFCETYFPAIFFYAWSKDLLRVIAKIERVIIDDETLAVAMPRGSGKSVLCRCAALWAILTARHPFVKLIGAVNRDSKKAILWFKSALSENDLLLADFPEVIYPIRKLNNDGRKAIGQSYHGARTRIGWHDDRLVMPTIPGSAASGFVIEANSLEGHVRGAWISLPDGRVVRPTLAICDDPQTRESARSQGPDGQTAFRLRVINEDVQGLAGPDRQTAILVPCTVILPGDLADQLLDRQKYPNYRGERTKRFYSWPTNKGLWEQYREIRDRLLRSDEPLDEATEFYRKRRATCGRAMDEEPSQCESCKRREVCMDCGAQVDWAERKGHATNLSAVQEAMHSLYKYGAAGFAAEFQNEPQSRDYGEERLTAIKAANRFNGRPQGEIPLECTELVMGVDVQKSSLWYVLAAWTPNFTGYVVEYGTWPRQNRTTFTLADIVDSPNSLQVRYPGRTVEGTIQAGLEDFITAMLNRDFKRAGGAGLMRIGRIVVDSGNWSAPIQAVKHKIGGDTVMLSKGVGIGAGKKPMSALKRKPGERPHGHHWYQPSVRGTREFPYLAIDTNWWKSFVHRGLLTAPGDPGAITLFGDNATMHALFAAHMTSETYVTPISPSGVPVDEWTLRPQRPDNHWWDCMVIAAVAASYQGIKCGSEGEVQARQSVRPPPAPMSLADMARAAKRATSSVA